MRGANQEGGNLCPLWTPLHTHRDRLNKYIRRKIPQILSLCDGSAADGRVAVLDVGCGMMPYRRFLDSPLVAAYDGADIDHGNQNISVRIFPESERIDAAECTYDLVVSFQVLEHVPDPLKLLSECYRVLHPGGVVFLTVPFLFEYHGVPNDYHRWTYEGLAHDLAAVGFSGVCTEAVESDWESILTVLQLFAARKGGYVLCKPIFAAANLLSLLPIRTDPVLCPLTIGAWAVR